MPWVFSKFRVCVNLPAPLYSRFWHAQLTWLSPCDWSLYAFCLSVFTLIRAKNEPICSSSYVAIIHSVMQI
ncbi:hypothetical protein RSAG8_13260, partial [Rhizoctonia solani AG-8 WAC10335]